MTFYKKKAFVIHHKVVHGLIPKGFDDIEIFQCHMCPKAFGMRGTLNTHIKINHDSNTVQERIKCTLCEMTFATKATLRNHFMVKHTGKVT